MLHVPVFVSVWGHESIYCHHEYCYVHLWIFITIYTLQYLADRMEMGTTLTPDDAFRINKAPCAVTQFWPKINEAGFLHGHSHIYTAKLTSVGVQFFLLVNTVILLAKLLGISKLAWCRAWITLRPLVALPFSSLTRQSKALSQTSCRSTWMHLSTRLLTHPRMYTCFKVLWKASTNLFVLIPAPF